MPGNNDSMCHIATHTHSILLPAKVTKATTSLQFYEAFGKRASARVGSATVAAAGAAATVAGSFSFWLQSWRKFDPIAHSFNRDLYAIVQLDVFSLLCRARSSVPSFSVLLLLCDLHNLQLQLLLQQQLPLPLLLLLRCLCLI